MFVYYVCMKHVISLCYRLSIKGYTQVMRVYNELMTVKVISDVNQYGETKSLSRRRVGSARLLKDYMFHSLIIGEIK